MGCLLGGEVGPGLACQKHLMNGEVISVKASQESSEVRGIKIALKILSIFPGTHFFF